MLVRVFLLSWILLFSSLLMNAQSIIHTEKGGYVSNLSAHEGAHSEESRREIMNIIASIDHEISDIENTQKSNNLLRTPVRQNYEKGFLQNKTYDYVVSQFFDHVDANNFLEDFNCGHHTYDAHSGTDYFGFPFYWYQYENDMLEVVAAQDGKILAKNDGVIDGCNNRSTFGNWVIIDHGVTQSFYAHLKYGSVTTDTVGSDVSKDDLIGLVGYSGNSTKPHLHFETYLQFQADTLFDPYRSDDQSCEFHDSHYIMERNGYNEYQYSTLLSLTSHDREPIWKTECDDQEEEPFFKNDFKPGDEVVFIIAARDMKEGQILVTDLKDPNGNLMLHSENTLKDIIGRNSSHQTALYLKETYTFQDGAQPGDWNITASFINPNTFQRIGQRVEHEVSLSVTSNIETIASSNFSIYPQPALEQLYINFSAQLNVPSNEVILELKDMMGKTCTRISLDRLQSQGHLDVSDLSSGLYFVQAFNQNGLSYGTRKIIIQ